MNLPYIKLFTDFSATVDLLSDAEAGRLIKAVLHYANGQEVPLPGQERLIFAMLKTQIDRDAASYQRYCDKQRENGSKGGRPKKPTETQENPNNPVVFAETQESQDKDKDKEEEKEKEKEKDKDERIARAKAKLAMFERFWAAYPRKTAKQDAIRAFRKLDADETLLAVILDALEKQKAAPQWSDPRYIPHPATWLNGRRWEDEPVESRPLTPQTDYEQREYDERRPGEMPDWLKEEIRLMAEEGA